MDNKEAEKPQREARFADDTKQDGGPLHKTITDTTNGADTEKGSSTYAASTTGLDHRIETSKAERRLLLKLGALWDCALLKVAHQDPVDVIILPLAVLLYLSAYLDRGNLGK
jgi:hypothetical protein